MSDRLSPTIEDLARGIAAGSFRSFVLPLPGGWWVATHCSNADKVKRMKQACEVVGLEFGRDVVVELPTGVRGEKDG